MFDENVSYVGEEHDLFTIELRPTSKCNYNCYYCTDLHINKNPILELDIDKLSVLIDCVKKHTNKTINIFVCGGEPTLYAGLIDIINSATAIFGDDDFVTIQTNMSKSKQWFDQAIKKIEHPEQVIFNGSYHNTQPGVVLMDYIKKCINLKRHNLLGMVSFGYNKQKCVISDYQTGVRFLGEEHCEIVPLINASVDQNPHKGNGTDDEIDITMDRLDVLKNTGHFFDDQIKITHHDETTSYVSRASMWKARSNNFHGSMCSIPKHKIYIDWDGNCYKCFNEQFSSTTPIFNINSVDRSTIDQYFMKDMKCMRCPFTTCFFDLEYQKNMTDIDKSKHIKIDKYFNTHEFRS